MEPIRETYYRIVSPLFVPTILLLTITILTACLTRRKILFLAPYRTESLHTKTMYTKVNPLADIILNTSGYTEPTLHFTLTYPDNSLFLYTHQNSRPEVVKLPKIPIDLCPHREQEYLSQLVKFNLNYMEENKYSNENKKLFDIKDIDIDNRLQNALLHEINEKLEHTSGESSKIYLDSEEYLSQIKNEDIIEEIKSHTVSEFQLSIEDVRSKLMRHIENIERPVYDSTIGEIKSNTISESHLSIEDIRSKLMRHIRNIERSFYDSDIDVGTIVNNDKEPKEPEKIDENCNITTSKKRSYNKRKAQREKVNKTENIHSNAVSNNRCVKKYKKTGIGDATSNLPSTNKRYNLRSSKQETGK